MWAFLFLGVCLVLADFSLALLCVCVGETHGSSRCSVDLTFFSGLVGLLLKLDVVELLDLVFEDP